jgi:hypothetical protein
VGVLCLLTPWGLLLTNLLALGYGAAFLATHFSWNSAPGVSTAVWALFYLTAGLVFFGSVGEGTNQAQKDASCWALGSPATR